MTNPTRTIAPVRLLALGAAALASTALGCVTELAPRATSIELELAIGPEGASVLAQRFVRAPNPPVDTPSTLTWIARDAHGRALDRGTIADTRELSYEDLAAPEEAHFGVTGPTGFVSVRVPQIDGTLEIQDASEVVLATIRLSRTAHTVEPLLASSDVLGAPTTVPASASGPTRVLFLPEGFREEELPTFSARVEAVVARLHTHPDYGALWDRFTFLQQDVRSRESGLDRPDLPGVALPHGNVDTAFDVTMGIDGVPRLASFGTTSGRAAAERLRSAARADVVVILVNTSEWCGAGGAPFTVNCGTDPYSLTTIIAHEMGHSLFGLGDEYAEPDTTAWCARALSRPNVSDAFERGRLPWADLLTTDVLPTPDTAEHASDVGAFEGGGYCVTGRYRPQAHCLMRDTHPRFCPVCRREMERRLGVSSPTPTSPGGMPSEGLHTSIRVVNRTGGGLWARCASTTESDTCSGWTWVRDGDSEQVHSFDGRYELHNQDEVPGVAIRTTFRADSDVVEVRPDAAHPFGPPPAPGCADTCTYARDGLCDDGGDGSSGSDCALGTDCADCGARGGDPTPPATDPPATDPPATDPPADPPVSDPPATDPPAAGCDDTCAYAGDGVCDDGSDGGTAYCALGTDCSDCAALPEPLCEETCRYAADGECDDGGAGSITSLCAYGSDCTDCGAR